MHFSSRMLIILGALVALLGTVSTGAAAGPDGPRFSAYTQGYSRADVDNGGSYSRSEMGVSAGYQWLTLSYKQVDYNWHGHSALSGGENPWDRLHRLALDAKFDGYLSDSVDWFAGGTLISAFEDQMWGSFSVAPRAGLVFHGNSDFRFRLGVLGLISPARVLVAPLVGMEWRQPSDYGFSARLGFPATEVQYKFNDMFAARANVRWDWDVYRLKNHSAVAHKGYVEENSITGGAYLDITPLDRFTLTLGAEVMGYRSLDVYNNHGNKLSETKVDPSVGAVFRAGYSF